MNYYCKGLDPLSSDNAIIVASGNHYNRTVFLYPEYEINSLEDWETIMRDDGEQGLSFFDEYQDSVPAHLIIKWIDDTANLKFQNQ